MLVWCSRTDCVADLRWGCSGSRRREISQLERPVEPLRHPRGGGFDPTKPEGLRQQAPLTAEYQKTLADSRMPQMMTAFMPLEIIVTPETTYIMLTHEDPHRRIYTDGRDWPKEIDATFQGYSIGHWIDEDGDGRYDVLEVDTRGPFKGPRAYDHTGLPVAKMKLTRTDGG